MFQTNLLIFKGLDTFITVSSFVLYFEIPFYSASILINGSFTAFYMFKPAYSEAYSKVFFLRNCATLIMLALSMNLFIIFSIFFFLRYDKPPLFILIHAGFLTFCYFFSTMSDFFHSHSYYGCSRGPFPLYLPRLIEPCLLFYFYYSFKEENYLFPGSIFFQYFNLIALVLSILRSVSHIPIRYPNISDRERRALEIRADCTQAAGMELSYKRYCNCLFLWIGKMIKHGFYGELVNSRCLPALPSDFNLQRLENLFSWPSSSNVRGCKIIVNLMWKHFKIPFLLISVLKFGCSLLGLAYPYLLNRFISELADYQLGRSIVYGILLVLIPLLSTFLDIQYLYHSLLLRCKFSTALTGLAFRHILKLTKSHIHDFGSGNLINLVTNDVDRISQCISSFTDLWIMPFQTILAIVLLCLFLGASALVGILFLIIFLFLNRLIATKIGTYSRIMMLQKDQRVLLLSQMLSNMHAVKVTGLEGVLFKQVEKVRVEEVAALKVQKLLDACCVFLWAAIPPILSCSTFVVYALSGHKLDPATIFAGLGLLNMLILPMNALPWVLNSFMEALVSGNRISQLFSTADQSQLERLGDSQSDDSPLLENQQINSETSPTTICDTDILLKLDFANFYWSATKSEDSDDPNPVATLKSISLEIKKGSFSFVLGPNGSGKTSLVYALMGELYGDASPLKPEKISFACQEPWIQRCSLLENILMQSDLDHDLLDRVLDACCLTADISDLPKGLNTNCGEAGSRLSGGQKARLNLARAVYQRDANLFILDDPLSSLDSNVAATIIRRLFSCEDGLLKDKGVVFVANKLPEGFLANMIRSPNKVFHLERGRITCTEDGLQLRKRSLEFTKQESDPNASISRDSSIVRIREEEEDEEGEKEAANVEKFEVAHSLDEENELEGTMSADLKGINSKVFLSYVRWAGIPLSLAVALSLTLMQAGNNCADFWLSIWTNSSQTDLPNQFDFSMWFYLAVYGSIIASVILFTSFRAVTFAYAGIRASIHAHRSLLETTVLVSIWRIFSSEGLF